MSSHLHAVWPSHPTTAAFTSGRGGAGKWGNAKEGGKKTVDGEEGSDEVWDMEVASVEGRSGDGDGVEMGGGCVVVGVM